MRAQDRTSSFFRCWLRPVLVGIAVSLIACIGLLMLMALIVQSVDVPRSAIWPLALAMRWRALHGLPPVQIPFETLSPLRLRALHQALAVIRNID